MNTFSAGFDYSCAKAAFAVLDSSFQHVFDVNFTMPPRDASSLPLLMEQKLADFGLAFDNISAWSVGAGPGSFTGLRLAASFIKGVTFAKSVKRRSVPTASALAATLELSEERVLTLYDGRKNELLAYGLQRLPDGSYDPDGMRAVISAPEDLENLAAVYPVFAVNQPDAPAVELFLKKLPHLADRAHIADRIDAAHLVTWRPEYFERDLSDLIYLRPAVFVEPKKIRTFSEA